MMENICIICKTNNLARLFLEKLEINTNIKWRTGMPPTKELYAFNNYTMFFFNKTYSKGCLQGCSWEDWANAIKNRNPFVQTVYDGKYKIYII